MSTSANSVPIGRRPGRPGRPPAKKAGPRPARHIPWPEIFKHHISLVEGHLKMIDMVRKHTVEGSGNHRTISNLVDRAHGMLKDAKAVQREFVAPKDAWQSVPIGSSSDTMYPGYSPKDHEYGKAAQEFGKEWSEAKKRGATFETGPDGPEYQFGQSKGSKKRRLEAPVDGEPTAPVAKSEKQDAATNADPLFFFDSNPTPINGLAGTSASRSTTTNSSSKPKASSKSHKTQQSEPTEAITNDNETPVIEYENIDREVDARLKLKADAQKNKKEKKRKRESNPSAETEADADAAPEEASTSLEQPPTKKPRSKKKSSKDKTTEKEAVSSDTNPVNLPSRDKTTTNEAAPSAATTSASASEGENDSAQTKKAKKRKDSPDAADTEHKTKRGRKSKSRSGAKDS